ncbi:subtilase family protein [Mycobacterium kansasii 824]|nr:subtilase family protein [Mycobacterium kansasii 824]
MKAGTLNTVARAVVHAANMGAKVINISVTACLPAVAPADQRALGAALWYAATVKDAVIVAAAGNDGEAGCDNNPMYDPLDPADPRDWHQVKVVSSPSWFSDYVLSVGAVDASGAPSTRACRARGSAWRHREPTSWVYRHKAVDRSTLIPPRGRVRRTCRFGAPASRRPTSAAWRRWYGPSFPT